MEVIYIDGSNFTEDSKFKYGIKFMNKFNSRVKVNSWMEENTLREVNSCMEENTLREVNSWMEVN